MNLSIKFRLFIILIKYKLLYIIYLINHAYSILKTLDLKTCLNKEYIQKYDYYI